MLWNLPAVLEKKGLLTPAQLEAIRALEAANPQTRLDRLILENQFVTEEQWLQTLAGEMGFRYVDLEVAEPQPEAIAATPAKFVFKNRVMPLEIVDGILFVATSEPLDILALDELEAMTDLVVEPVFATQSGIARRIKKHFGVAGDTIGDMVLGDAYDPRTELDAADEEEMAQQASVIKLVNEILVEAVRERASDIHIEPEESGLVIRYRIDGVLQMQNVPPEIHRFQPAIASRLKIMSKLNIAEKRKPQDGRIKMRVDDREIDLRVSIIPMLHGEGIVMRVLDKGKMKYDLRAIGMDAATYEAFRKLILLPHGIVLVTGPTGSGKSTTLYSALAEIKDEQTKIITVEDPVEYQMAGISQIQVNHKVGLDFAASLRSVLRHDPDVILVGEIRDFETAQIAIQAAMTGHLVFSTLHTNDAASAFARLVDMGVEPYLVASTVAGVMAQRLVRTVCKQCRQTQSVPFSDLPPDLVEFVRSLPEWNETSEDSRESNGVHDWRQEKDRLALTSGTGCPACRQSGYAGRIGMYELLATSPAIQQLAIARSSAHVIKQQAVNEGMRTLRQSGWGRVVAGQTTIEEVLRVTKDEELPERPAKPESSSWNQETEENESANGDGPAVLRIDRAPAAPGSAAR